MRELWLPELDAALRFHDLPGADPAVLFIHGLGCAATIDFIGAARDPRLAGRRTLLVDLLGFGVSDRPDGFSYTLDEHARTILRLLDALALAPVVLVGHSMGGPIAVRVAEGRPDRIERLVLLEPNLGPGGGRLSRAIAAEPESDYVARGHGEVLAANGSDDPAPVVRSASFAARLRLAAPHAISRSARSLVADGVPSTGERLAALNLPRMMLHGSRSGVPPDARAAEAAGVRLIEVADAGHDMMHDAPDAFAAALTVAIA